MARAEKSVRDTSQVKKDILDATLAVILDCGIRGVTWRKIATRVALSPGTLTYHFSSIEQLLIAAFTHMVEGISHAFTTRLLQAQSRQSATEAVVDLICGNIWATPNHLRLSFELYALAAREEVYRLLLQEWMTRSRNALQHHFSQQTACALDALIEGYTIHNFLNSVAVSREDIAQSVVKIIAD